MIKNRSLKYHIPNFITSVNLLFGCLSIVFALQGKLIPASLLVFAAGILDFFDGFAARILHAYSEFGKMLDSLADVVSFGVAPSAILYMILYGFFQGGCLGLGSIQSLIPFTGFIIAIFSALRLAKFNIDDRQVSSFIGLPTPANAFLIASFPFIDLEDGFLSHLILHPYVLIPLIIVLSLLLVSEIPMISLKFKNVSFKDNRSRFILLFLSLVLLVFLRISAIPFIFLLYIVLSLVDNPQENKA